MEDHIKLNSALINRGRETVVIDPTHGTLKAIILNITIGSQIRDSDVDKRITLSQIFRSQKSPK